MADLLRVAELLNAVVDQALSGEELNGMSWDSYGLVAEVMDDGSTVQAAYAYPADGSAVSLNGYVDGPVLVAMRDASRADDGRVWDFFVLKIHRPSGQAATKYLVGDEAADWSMMPDNDERLRELLRARQEDFSQPIA